MIAADDVTWATLASCSAGGLWCEKNTKWGAAASSNVITMLSTLVLVNCRVLPAQSRVYSLITSKLVPLAVPLLLLDADLDRVRRDGRSLLLPFAVASAATIFGTLIAWRLTPLPIASLTDRATIAAALAARHIGGAVNYVAVTEAGSAPPSLVAAGIAADNVIVALYFSLLFYFTREGTTGDDDTAAATSATDQVDTATPLEASAALAFALVIVAAASFLASSSTLLLPLCTLLTVAVASAAPKPCRKLAPAGRVLGTAAMQLFVAAVGAAGNLRAVASAGSALLLFSFVQIACHLATLLGARRLFPRRFADIRKLAVASNAAVGGPTTAAAMATAKKWDDLILPALLVGILGYATGTFLALGLKSVLLRL